MIPVLHQDGSRLDWKSAEYRVDVEASAVGAVVSHELHQAPELLASIENGDAAYAVEIRCPRTLLARTHESQESRQEVAWLEGDVDGQIYLFPGVLALEEISLPTTGLIDLWEEGHVRVPAGSWLARGTACAAKNLAASLLEFRKDDELGEGRMKVEEDTSGEDPRFLVRLAPDVYERARGDRDIQVAGLIAAFAMLPSSSSFGENSESPVARMLRDRLEQEDVPTWDDGDSWDPALAATAIERFHPAPFEESAR